LPHIKLTLLLITCLPPLTVIEFVQTHIFSSKIVQLFTRTIVKWQQDDCIEMGAALSYYAIFSLFPILLVILSITGLILGPDTSAYVQILLFAKGALPIEAYRIVEGTLVNLNESSLGAGIIGFFYFIYYCESYFLVHWIVPLIKFGKSITLSIIVVVLFGQ
jgi:membrane protein